MELSLKIHVHKYKRIKNTLNLRMYGIAKKKIVIIENMVTNDVVELHIIFKWIWYRILRA